MKTAFVDYYRCPEELVNLEVMTPLKDRLGFFRFGTNSTCYGLCADAYTCDHTNGELRDALPNVVVSTGNVRLPFDLNEVVDNLRLERYSSVGKGCHGFKVRDILKDAYYMARPFTPAFLRTTVQRLYFRGWKQINFPSWPLDTSVDSLLQSLMLLLLRSNNRESIPFIWFWPNGFSSCAIMTHDVETETGRTFCSYMMDLDDSVGIKSSFQIVPERRYRVSGSFLRLLSARGFEINIHDLHHDGQLFRSRKSFEVKAKTINRYAKDYGAQGFRAGAMYRHPEWLKDLEVSYDMSIPNVAHIEPQRGGCCTVLPYFIGDILELPLTTTQDWALYYVLRDPTLNIWKHQIDLIIAQHGLISFIVHPDYTISSKATQLYRTLLEHLSVLRAGGKLWIALPREVNTWWRQRAHMRLVHDQNRWTIEGEGKHRARIAYASLVDGKLTYNV